MTHEEMLEMSRIISAGWDKVQWDADRLERWQDVLGDLPGQKVLDAAKLWLKHQIRAPRPADLREAVLAARERRPDPGATRCLECGGTGWRDVIVTVDSDPEPRQEYPAVVPCGCSLGRSMSPHVTKTKTTVTHRPNP